LTKGGYRFRSLTEAAVLGIGFTRDMLSRETRALSGGEKNRLALAQTLCRGADLLLLDEPDQPSPISGRLNGWRSF